jgi:hypothetical protein
MGTGQIGRPPEGAFIIDRRNADFRKFLSVLVSLCEKLSFKEREKMIAEIARLSKELLHTDPELLLQEVGILAQLYGSLNITLKKEGKKDVINVATARLGEIETALRGLQEMSTLLQTKSKK